MFNRRKFIQSTAVAAGTAISSNLSARDGSPDLIIGHGNLKYKVDKHWAKADPKTHQWAREIENS